MEIMKNLSRHIRRWNRWRKRNANSRLHHILVLLGVVKSPTFAFTLLPEEIDILGDVSRTKCMNTWICPPDCNECKWLNITEQQQKHSLKRTVYNEHACTLYGKRLFHKTKSTTHLYILAKNATKKTAYILKGDSHYEAKNRKESVLCLRRWNSCLFMFSCL